MTAPAEAGAAKVPVEIVSRFDRARVLFRAEVDATIPLIGRIRAALQIAVNSRANLSRANLSRADLSGAYLSGANLSGANLSRADLSRADLSGAYLSGANLSRADLSGAYLSGANLSRADLSGAYLSRANLSGANLSGAYLSRAYLSGANLSGANLSGANLSGANLSGPKWRDDVTLKRGPVKEATRTDGYRFLLLDCDVGWRVVAGCRFFALDEAWRHWGHGPRAGTPLGEESEDILVMFEHQIEREMRK